MSTHSLSPIAHFENTRYNFINDPSYTRSSISMVPHLRNQSATNRFVHNHWKKIMVSDLTVHTCVVQGIVEHIL